MIYLLCCVHIFGDRAVVELCSATANLCKDRMKEQNCIHGHGYCECVGMECVGIVLFISQQDE